MSLATLADPAADAASAIARVPGASSALPGPIAPPAGDPAADSEAAHEAALAALEGKISVREAILQLDALPWSGLWAALARLDVSADGSSRLETLLTRAERIAPLIEDLGAKAAAAASATVLARHAGKELPESKLALAAVLTRSIPRMDGPGRGEVLRRIGVSGLEAEGLSLLMDNLEVDFDAVGSRPIQPSPPFQLASATAPPGGAGVDHDVKPPDGMQYGRWIGWRAHVNIAAYYMTRHPPPVCWVWANYFRIEKLAEQILEKHAPELTGEPLAAILAIAKPDIFDFSLARHPPYVYEIKPWHDVAGAQAQVAKYIEGLWQAKIPAIPGPPGVPGTSGRVRAAAGWVSFTSPIDGVILYRYARDQERSRAPVPVPLPELLRKLRRDFEQLAEKLKANAGLLALILLALAAGAAIILVPELALAAAVVALLLFAAPERMDPRVIPGPQML